MYTTHIFLDLDGVLQGSYASRSIAFRTLHKKWQELGVDNTLNGDEVEINKLEKYSLLCNKYKAVTVLISSVADPDMSEADALKWSKAFGSNVVGSVSSTISGTARINAILQYIEKHKIKNYIVIDDSKGWYTAWFTDDFCIWPHGRYGLQDRDFEKLESMLSKKAAYHYVPNTTKICPYCHNDKLSLLYSYNKKYCLDCCRDFDWHLSAGQKPL